MSGSRSLALLCLLSAIRASGSSSPGECTIYHPPPVYNMTPTPTNVTHPSYGPGWFDKTNAPVSAPSKMPTSDDEICISKTEPDEVSRHGNYPTTGDILRITQMSNDGNTVTFKVRQQWTPNTVELLAVQFTEVGGTSPTCKTFPSAASGPLAPSFKASCTNTNAVVTVIARDPTVFAGEATYQAPGTCGSIPAGKTISITYNVPCNPGCGETVKPLIEDTAAPVKPPSKAPTTAPTKAPSQGPSKAPSKTPTKKPTKAPTKGPTKKPTKAPTKSPTKRPTKAPTLKPVTKKPTKAPTKAPTRKPTLPPTNPPDFCLPNIQRDAISGTIEGTSWPIEIVSKNGGTVDIRVKQTFKQDSVSWVATQFVDDKTGLTVCPKKNSVPFGVVDYSTGDSTIKYPTIIRAKCTKGIAKVALFVHDGSAPFVAQPVFTIPEMCNPSQDTGNKIGLYFSVPCQECAGFAPTTPKALPTKAPTKAPTKGPTKAPTKGPTKGPTKAPVTRSPTKTPTKKPTKAPTKSPTKKPTKAPTKKPTKAPTKGPTKAPTKGPTGAPVKKVTSPPTSAPTVCVPRLNITRTGRHGSVEPAGSLIKITQQSTDGKSVRIAVSQEYKLNALALVAVQFEDVNWGSKCSRFENVPGGNIEGGSILAKCVSGWADVTVYARDDCFSTVPTFTLPATCGGNVGNIVMQQFRVPCNPGCPGYAPIFDPVPTRAPSKAPTKAPTKRPTKFPTKTPTKKPTKAPTKKPTSSPVQACVPLTLKETKRVGNVTAAEPLVSNIRFGAGGTSVTFNVNQWYKLTNLPYFAVEYTDFNSGATCRNSKVVPSGVFAGDFVARCVNNVATVRVYGYDDCFSSITGVTIPAICAPPGAGKATMSEFTVPCALGC